MQKQPRGEILLARAAMHAVAGTKASWPALARKKQNKGWLVRGSPEKSNKSLVGALLDPCLSGMSQSGNPAGILTVRGWTQSERFDHAWALLAATYRLQVTVIDVGASPTRSIPT